VVVIIHTSPMMPVEKAMSGSFGKRNARSRTGHQPLDTVNDMPEAGGLGRFPPSGENKNKHHGGKIDDILPQGTFHIGFWHVHGCLGFGFFFFSKEKMHDQPDDDAKDDCAYRSCNTDGKPKNPSRQYNGQHIDGRTGIKKGNGWSKPCPPLPDACKKRQDRTGADR
jgi:hypothetical protein